MNLILNPFLNVSLSRARMLAPDGHCKTFDASADGYVRSDGCGLESRWDKVSDRWR